MAELDAYFCRAQPLHAFAPRTVTTEAGLREVLEKVRRDGYCLGDGELDPDLRAIAVPVMNATGGVAAALNVSTAASRTPKRQLTGPILGELRRSVAEMRPLPLG